MSAALAPRAYARPQIPASVNAFVAIIDHYGFDHFFRRTLPMIDMNDTRYAEVIDEALDRHAVDYELNSFSVRRAFGSVLRDLMDEHGYSRKEALEVLAEDGYVVPGDIAMNYSVDAGDADVERLSTLIRNRARRMLKQSND